MIDMLHDKRGHTIALLGPRGTGKTQLASFAVRHVCRLRGSGLYRTAFTMMEELKDGFGKERRALLKYTKPGILVLDEFHDRQESEWADAVISNVIDHRYGEGLDTILISNLTPDAFKDRAGLSIVRRIRETGAAFELIDPVPGGGGEKKKGMK